MKHDEIRMAKRFMAKLLLLAATLACVQTAFFFAYTQSQALDTIRRFDGWISGLKDSDYISAVHIAWPPVPEILWTREYVAQGAEVFYLGDSTTTVIDPEDTDRRNLETMLADALPEFRVCAISRFAYPIKIFADYCAFLAHADSPPKAVVMPINLRVFSPTWDERPQWQFKKTEFLLAHTSRAAHVFLPPLAALDAVNFNPISQAEYDKTPITVGNVLIGYAGDLDAMRWKMDKEAFLYHQFQYYYETTLRPENRQLLALADAATTLLDKGILPVFYITPIDVETGTRVVGAEFPTHVAANVALVESTLKAKGLKVIDLSSLVGAEDFCPYVNNLHEHLNDAGRHRVTKRIAAFLREGLKAD